jgi:hypothetical protein
MQLHPAVNTIRSGECRQDDCGDSAIGDYNIVMIDGDDCND